MKRAIVFISSVQKEMAGERRAIRDFVRADPLLRQFYDVFLFEEQPRRGATITDIDPAAIGKFVLRARAERQFPLAEKAQAADVLTHLHLLVDGKVSNAALLLFGRDPQQFIIEKYGTGTLMMIRESVKHELPEPRFELQQPGEFGITIWRDWLTDEVMNDLGLNGRQKAIVLEAKMGNGISNSRYREITGCSESTSLRELRQLANLGVFTKVGGTGRSAHYTIATAKPVINPSNPSSGSQQQTRHKPVTKVSNINRSTVEAMGAQRPHSEGTYKRSTGVAAAQVTTQLTAQVVHQVGTKSALSRHQVEILHKCLAESTLLSLMIITGRTDRTKFRHQVLNPILNMGLIEMTVPGKPRSSSQKYRLTDKGRKHLEQVQS